LLHTVTAHAARLHKLKEFAMTRLKLVLACAAMGSPLPLLAGSVMEMMTTEYREDPPVIGTVQISTQGGMSRMEVTSAGSDGSGGMIFREQGREFIAIDHEEKEYYVIDEAAMERIGTQMNSALQQMQQALEEMPPEQRAMAEQMMKQHLPVQAEEPAPLKVNKTGASDTINGFDCEYFEVQQNGAKVRELCITGWDDIEGGREAADSMIAMAAFFEKMAEQFSAGSGMDVMGEQRDLFRHMRDLEGYPVLSREFDEEGALESESRLKSAKSSDIDPALFSPPQGYKQKDIGI
jgi:hypothetical protein